MTDSKIVDKRHAAEAVRRRDAAERKAANAPQVIQRPALVFTGPELPEGRKWCQPGIMFWKRAAIEHYIALGYLDKDGLPLVEGNNDDKTVLTLPLDVGQVPGPCYEELVGLCAPLPMLGFISICWTHVAGMQVQQQSRLQQGMPGMPIG